MDGGLVCGSGVEPGGSGEGDRIGWFGDFAGQDDTVWEDGSRLGGKEEEAAAGAFMGHPG